MTGTGSCKKTQYDDGLTGGSIMKELVFQKNDVIFKQGQFQSTMFDIGKGCIGIYANYGEADEKQLAVFGPEQVFGEMGMIDGEPRSATAVVMADNTTLETIYPEDLEELIETNPLKVDMIMQHLSGRLRHLTADYADACEEVSTLANWIH